MLDGKQPETWELRLRDELLGVLQFQGRDRTWILAEFEPTPAFDVVQPRFEEELRLVEEGSDWGAVERIWDQFQAEGLELCCRADGARIHRFLLHVRGKNAWFYY